jgi:hypothetical protein
MRIMNRPDWELFRVSLPPSGWMELEDSTWDALVAALAGEENVLRRRRNGSRTDLDDQEIIDDTIDAYLAAADIPPRPRGYDWYLRPPPGVPTLRDLHTKLNEYIGRRNPQASLPQELRELIRASLRELYP